jgi:peptidoglycan/xylan/chitin deacetylase (PgdA/CDA1 family)
MEPLNEKHFSFGNEPFTGYRRLVKQQKGVYLLGKYAGLFLCLFLTVILTGCNAHTPYGSQGAISPGVIEGSQGTPQVSANNTSQNLTETIVKPTVSPVKRAVPPGRAALVVWYAPIKQRAVFITIDDGWFTSPRVLQLMKFYHLPLTAFLIQKAAAQNIPYWQEFVSLGGSVEDHTYSHPLLTKVSSSEDLTQIASPIKYFRRFGVDSTEFRPPYGNCDIVVQKMAAKAGIKYVVMWDAIMSNGRLTTYNGKPLAPGDIVLMHWLPGLGQDLETLLGILKQENLGVASLSDALDGRPVQVALPEEFDLPSTNSSVYKSVYNSRV